MANIMAVLGLEVDASGAVRSLRDVDSATNRTSKNVRELQQLLRALGLAWGVYEVVQFTKNTIALADAYTTMSSRLALVTHNAENLAEVQRDLFGIAQESRTPLESVSLLYERLARVSGELGLNQQELLRHTETINKAMVISGTSAEGTRAALVQLSQGFAAGTLRGDELNAVLEQAPRLAQAIADGMGVSVGQLRRMGAEGKLTAGEIVKALEDQAEAIDREFSGMEMTVGGAMTRLRNSWMMYVGDANEASGATSGLAEAINGLADAIEPVGEQVNAFFGGISLLAVDASVNLRKLQHEMVNLLPEWMASDSFISMSKKMPGPFGASFGASIENLRYMRGLDQDTFFAELDKYREEEEARITGVTARASSKQFGAGLSDDDGTGATVLTTEQKRQLKAYQDLRQEMRYAREDLELEVRDLDRSALAREYARNALEDERRVRDIIANQAPEYREELIKESEALHAAANARAQKTQKHEREQERLKALIAAEHEATEQFVALEQQRREAFERPFENAIENIQRGWGDLFTQVLADGEATAADLGRMFHRAGGEMVAGLLIARTQKRLAGFLGSDDADLTSGQRMNRDMSGGALMGGALGFGLGYNSQSAGGGVITGAISGAAAGGMMFGALGAAAGGAAGAIGGLVGGILGAGEAAEEARERMAAFDRSMRALEMQTAGDSLGMAMVEVEETIGRLLDQIGLASDMSTQEAMAFAQRLKNSTGRDLIDDVQRIIDLEGELYERAQERYELEMQRLEDDLSVRALVAQGRDEEAARLRLQIQHQRELDDLTRAIDADGMRTAAEEALLAQMLYTQELERTTQAMNGLNRSAANLPATFRMAGYVFDAMQEMTADAYRRAVFGGGPGVMPSAPPSTIPTMPVAGAGSGGMIMVSPDQPFVLQINGKEISRFTLRDWKRGASGPGKEQTARILSDITVS